MDRCTGDKTAKGTQELSRRQTMSSRFSRIRLGSRREYKWPKRMEIVEKEANLFKEVELVPIFGFLRKCISRGMNGVSLLAQMELLAAL